MKSKIVLDFLAIMRNNFGFVFLFEEQNKLCADTTAVGLGQQRSQAVDLGFESLSCQIFLRVTFIIF